ncbi:hypothetical protein WJX82_002025 [Trebouxia sp. C0006]
MSASARDERRLQRIESFKQVTHPSSEWQYNFRDVILYALSIGCRRTEREFVYENDCDFAALPSFAVVAVHKARLQYQDLLPNFDPRMLLHGEQYVEVFCPLPTNGKFVVKPSLIDIQDKGKAALVITRASIVDPDTNKVYAINEGKPNSIKSIKAQFAMYVFPGETLRTEMWREGPSKIIFQTRVLERDVLAITKAAIELTTPSTSKL